MQKITVTKVETKFSKDGSKEFYAITDIDKTEFTSFDKGSKNLSKGAIIWAEVIVKGKYNNIQSFKLVQEGAEPKKPEPKDEPLFPDEPPEYKPMLPQSQSVSIEGQGALKGLIEIALSDKGTPLDLEYCKKIAYWKLFTWTGIDPASVSPTTKEVKTPPVPKESNVGVSKTLPTPEKIKPETADTIKTWWERDDGAYSKGIFTYMAKELKRVKVSDLTESEGQQLLEALKEGKIKEVIHE